MKELTEAEKKHVELIHEQARHSKTVRDLEYTQSVLDDFVATVQDLTGEYYGEHSNENDPWENALNALQEMADAKHPPLNAGSADMTSNATR